jgi:outer membrane protein assembly factor BamA
MVNVRVKVMEADPRLVSGDLGYVTDGGLSTEARWTHRYFSGGGRSLTVSGLAQTGWLAVTEDADIRYRLGVSLKQPSIGLRYTSAVLTPFIEYRDDTQDRSNQVGLNTTLVYRVRQLRSLSLDYQIARRNVHEYHFEDLATGEIDLLTFLTQAAQGQLDSLGSTLQTSAFTLSANLGRLDDPANPRRGWVLRPAVQTTAPTSISSTAYWRLDMAANAFLPLGRFAVLAARASAGHLYPFGKSVPSGADDPQTKFLQLREASFTAGGTGDARGWENRLLGPKVPDVRFETVGDTLVPEADGYVPLGGFARGSFSLELQVPLAGVIRNLGSHFFLDGGRVWTDDERFGMAGDPFEQERLFYAAGAGLDVRTPVGPVKVSVGYKLNPSITDLVDADDLLVAVNSGQGTDALHRKNSRRWQWHLAIGTSY